MVAFNDRRPGSFTVTTHGYDQQDAWSEKDPREVRDEVRSHYSSQYPDSPAWAEANRLATRRTDHGLRRGYHATGLDYANDYQEHLVRVMAVKGPQIMEKTGDKWDSVRDTQHLSP